MTRRLLVISLALIIAAFLAISAAAVGKADQLPREWTANSPAATSMARKGDRLPSVAPARQAPAAVRRVPLGCEPAISPLARPRMNYVGACVS